MQFYSLKTIRNSVCFTACLIAGVSQAEATEMRFYNDATGRPAGSSMRFGDTTFYNDAYGRPLGSAQRFGDQTYYNDAYGRPAGSSMEFGSSDD